MLTYLLAILFTYTVGNNEVKLTELGFEEGTEKLESNDTKNSVNPFEWPLARG